MTTSQGCVSFRIENLEFAGNLKLPDLFLLTYFAFLTCRRSKSDNVLSLAVVGVSTSGKSRVLEQPLLEISHLLVTSSKGNPGCGRFLGLRAKSVLAALDVPVSHLFGPDLEIFKNLSRGQVCTVKIHSDVQLIQPTFFLLTSNERIFTHSHHAPGKPPGLWTDKLWSDAERVLSETVKSAHLKAMRSRFLEMCIVKPCLQDPYDLKHCHDFNRIVAVVALFEPVVSVLNAYSPEDFYSDHLYTYCLQALEKNADLYVRSRKASKEDTCSILQRLKQLYVCE